MKEYNKIDTVYERDVGGTKKLIEGKFRNKTVDILLTTNGFLQKKLTEPTFVFNGMDIKLHLEEELKEHRFPLI